MIVWCKKCNTPIIYKSAAGFKHPFFHSATDQPTCLPCSVPDFRFPGQEQQQ